MQYTAFCGANGADFSAHLKMQYLSLLPKYKKYIFGVLLHENLEALKLRRIGSHQSVAFRILCKRWTLCLSNTTATCGPNKPANQYSRTACPTRQDGVITHRTATHIKTFTGSQYQLHILRDKAI
jgi:hypothetical protein